MNDQRAIRCSTKPAPALVIIGKSIVGGRSNNGGKNVSRCTKRASQDECTSLLILSRHVEVVKRAESGEMTNQ